MTQSIVIIQSVVSKCRDSVDMHIANAKETLKS